MKRCLKALGLIALLWPLAGLAHKPSDSYLTLNLAGATPHGQWDIALRDLEYALGLDADQDGVITWGELKARHAAIAAYALARLRLRSGDHECVLHPQAQQVDQHSDGAYTVLPFTLDCPPPASALRLEYRLFADLDPTHRGLLQIVYSGGVQVAVLGPDQPSLELAGNESSRWRQFADYWREGVWHIWLGFDHILFLVALSLPAVLWRENGRWRQAASLRPVVQDVVGVVTAFTVAHSLTLSAAVLGWISLPSRWVEAAIAATIILAALNNLIPLVQGRRWVAAFALGLIHGFGFASALKDLGLPDQALALALAGFNLGVESGQLVIVAALLPVAYLLRESWFYRRVALQLGSLAVLMVAGLWFVERSFDVNFWLP